MKLNQGLYRLSMAMAGVAIGTGALACADCGQKALHKPAAAAPAAPAQNGLMTFPNVRVVNVAPSVAKTPPMGRP